MSRLLSLTGFPGRRRFTARSLRETLEEAGLVVHRTETIAGLIPIGFVEGSFRKAGVSTSNYPPRPEERDR